MARLEPIQPAQHVLFDPQLNYLYFLGAAFAPTLLHLFIVFTGVMALGSELKEGTANVWLRTAGESPWKAVAGKLSVYWAWFSFLGLALLFLAPRRGGRPAARFRGHAGRGRGPHDAGGSEHGRGGRDPVSPVCVWPPVRLRFTRGTAFAFAGVTFPLAGMMPLARAWSELIPLSPFHAHLDGPGHQRGGSSVGLAGYALSPVFSDGRPGDRAFLGTPPAGHRILGVTVNFIRLFLLELGAIFRDKGARLILIGGVIIYTLVYPLPYAPEVLRQVNVAVVDLDHSALSRRLVRLAGAAPEVPDSPNGGQPGAGQGPWWHPVRWEGFWSSRKAWRERFGAGSGPWWARTPMPVIF